MVELFFDLVFVFAVTQLSHSLLAQLTLSNAMQVTVLLLATWWVWIYTSWVTNWLNPERAVVRVCLFVLILAGLLASASIPRAFADRGIHFAAAYVFMQLGRTLFFLWAVRRENIVMIRSFQRILGWFALSAAFWILGGIADAPQRLAWWSVALGIELLAPAALYWLPWLGRSSTSDWNIDGSHMAERCGLFVIIALGESLLVTGATFAELTWDTATIIGMLNAVVASIAMWWMYFDSGAERSHRRIVQSSDPGRQARIAYTYLHAPIVAGIIVVAVSDELVLAHPLHASPGAVATIIGGPLLYLLGNALFKWVTNDRLAPPLSHLVGMTMLLALVPMATSHWVSALGLSIITTVVMVIVAAWEYLALRRFSARTS